MLFLIFTLGICVSASAQTAVTNGPFAFQHIIRRDPNYSIYVVTVDLKDPRVSVHVSRGGPDPDGDGPWLTTLLPTSEIAAREHYAVAINGDFFVAKSTKDIEGKDTGYVRGKFAAPEGLAMTDGVLWHRPVRARPCLEITRSNVAKIEDGKSIDPAAREMIGGSQIIVQGGQPVLFSSAFATNRHPRTAVGINSSGSKLTLFVVDGRQPDLSIGMTLEEVAREMARLGCATAINLDGGGSTTLVRRDSTTKKLLVVNSPSDTKERSVADVLGVTFSETVR